MLRVGLTGGIGSGKSVVAGMFARLRAPVIDTDVISHELTRPGAPGYQEIIVSFGNGYLQSGGELDRQALRQRIFAHPADRHRLESILHPLIRRQVELALSRLDAPYVVLIVPLLIEAGFTDLVDRILVVDADENDQIRRTQNRSGLTEPEIRRIMQTQLDRPSRLAAAHDVIRNDAGLDRLETQVRELHEKYLGLRHQAE